MQYYQHRFENVPDATCTIAHRIYWLKASSRSIPRKLSPRKRSPAMSSSSKVTSLAVPIFPGALMQELTTQSAGILIAAEYNPMKEYDTADPFFNEYALGVLVKVKQARYKGFARPGDTLIATVVLNDQVSDVFDFSATIAVDGQKIMRIGFQLMNIRSQMLQGGSA